MEASETLVKILESIMQMNAHMLDSLLKMEQRQQDHNQAFVQLLDHIAARVEGVDARIAADNRALAEILERVVETTSRTEQMTARILTEVSKGAAH